MRHAGGLDEVTLSRAARTVGVIAIQRRGNRLIASDDSALNETIDECFDVVEAGIVPVKSVQTESAADVRRLLILSIDQRARRMLTQERPEFEADSQPFAICWTLSECGPRLRSALQRECTPVTRATASPTALQLRASRSAAGYS